MTLSKSTTNGGFSICRRTQPAACALAAHPGSASRPCSFLAAVMLVFAAAGMGGLFPAPPVQAQTLEDGRLVLGERAVWEYAERLFRDGEYYRAITEYKRLAHFFPKGALAKAARVRIGEAYLNGGEAASAADHFGRLLEDSAMAPYRAELFYLRGLGRLEQDAHLPYSLRESHIELALGDFRAVPENGFRPPGLMKFVQALEEPRGTPSKSPWLAGGLSAVLPGSGSFYVGRYGEGALALAVNALFLHATWKAYRDDNDGLGTVLAVGALAFYGGAIYAAANGAHKFNDRARATYLERQRTRFGIVLQPRGLRGMLEKRF